MRAAKRFKPQVKQAFIIAEAGVNHNGSLELGKKLIDCAARAGADAVKFQTFSADRLASRFASQAEYAKKTSARALSHHEMIRRLELSPSDHKKLLAHCRKRKIIFLSSPFDERGADLLERLGVKIFKLPSGELINLPFLRHVARKGRPIILSTGMANLGEIERALKEIRESGNPPVTLLQCVTEYPAPYNEINLRSMLSLRQAFNVPVGYSDHTPGIEVSVAAVALGATVIEKHFTLDREMEGPDHKASLEPDELTALIKAVRNVEAALGDGVKRPTSSELKNMPIARKSSIAARTIKKGEKLSGKMVIFKRPGYGISPAELPLALGRKTKRTIKADEVITWEDIA